jgi:hypothetical protein
MLFDLPPFETNPLDLSVLQLLSEPGPKGLPHKSRRMTPVALPNPADVPDDALARKIGQMALRRAGLLSDNHP